MRAAERTALHRLVTRYGNAHAHYRDCRRALGWSVFAATFGLPGATLILPVVDYVEAPHFSWWVTGRTWLLCALVVGMFVLVNRVRVARARGQLQELKHEVDVVGYVVACDLKDPVFPRLFVGDSAPKTEHVLFPSYPQIDFRKYDRAFLFPL